MDDVVAAVSEHPLRSTALATERPAKLSAAVIEALRAEFRSLVEGNLDDNLLSIEQLAAKTRELFLTLKGGEARLLGGRHPMTVSPGVYSVGNVGAWSGNASAWSGATSVGPVNVEQFGAVAIRQIVENLPEVAAKIAEAITNSPARLVEAIATARRNGLDDMADKLEKQLLSSKSVPAVIEASRDEPGPHGLPGPQSSTNGVQTNGSAAVGAEG